MSYRSLSLAMILSGILLLYPQYGIAGETIYSGSIPLTKTNWMQSLTIPKFNANLGSLSEIRFHMHSAIDGLLKIESLDAAPATITSHIAAEITLSRPDGSTILTHAPSVENQDTFAIFDGSLDYTGTSGNEHPIASESTDESIIIPAITTDLALFTGEGNIVLPIHATGISSYKGAGNIDTASNLSASAETTVTYVYTTPDLAMSMQLSEPFLVGDTTTITLSVRNAGQGPTTGSVTVTNVLPGGLRLKSTAAGNGWSCGTNNQQIVCTRTTPLEAGTTAPPIILTVDVLASALPEVRNTATVATTNDVNEHDGLNSSTEAITVSVPQNPQSSPGIVTARKQNPVPSSPPTVRTESAETQSSSLESSENPSSSTSSSEEGQESPPPSPTEEITTLQEIDAQGCEISEAYRSPLRSTDMTLCFELVPNRELIFDDIDGDPHANDITILKNTRIRGEGDYIVSGANNYSSGKQQDEFRQGVFHFEPQRGVSRVEIVKLALITNCIPIADELPESPIIFSDIPYARNVDDPLADFVSRVFYSAAAHGIVEGFADGSARPFAPASNAEVLAILLRASGTIPPSIANAAALPWYKTYSRFAELNTLIEPSLDPLGHMSRSEISALLLHVMAIHPDPAISGYIAQIAVEKNASLSREFLYRPIPLLTNLPRSEGTHCEETPPAVNACLGHEAHRSLTFSDVPGDHRAARFINTLKRTFVLLSGEYIVSGNGNFSTVHQQQTSDDGTWEYQPDRTATRFEIVKTVLASNCIPIANDIPEMSIVFADLPPKRSENPFEDLVARVFYTAAANGIITGDAEGDARPFDVVSRLEAVAILLRAAHALPEGYSPQSFSFPDLPSEGWYAKDVSFASLNRIIDVSPGHSFRPFDPLTRDELAVMLLRTMAYSSDIRLRAYRTSVNALLQ